MDYAHANIPTRYRNTQFRSRLEARWAAFADLAGWQWRYEPIELEGWIPDFWLAFRCFACSPEIHGHELYAEVKPYRTLAEFNSHTVARIPPLNVPSPAMLGWHPSISHWRMICAHRHRNAEGIGTGSQERCARDYNVRDWIYRPDPGEWRGSLDEYAEFLWDEAGNRTQWRKL